MLSKLKEKIMSKSEEKFEQQKYHMDELEKKLVSQANRIDELEGQSALCKNLVNQL